MVNDSIGDFIIQLKNASMAGKESVVVPHSKFRYSVAEKLRESGFVGGVSPRGKKTKRGIEVELLYGEAKDRVRTPRISDVKRMSKPGCRMYVGASDAHPVKYGRGALFLSTPDGILTDAEARKKKVGGEALFKIW